MLSQLKDDVTYVEPLEIQQAFVNLGDETSDLLVVERFFEALERRYLKEPRGEFDRSRIKANLRILEGFAGEIHRDKFTRLVNEIREGIRAWLAELQERDTSLEAYNLRRFCDDRTNKIEPIVYSALTRFYRTVGGSPSSQSKFDLVITRLFSRTTEPPFRSMLIEREDLEAQIEALFEGWDHGTPVRRSPAHVSLVIAKLDDFRREAEALAEYNQLLKSDIFERLRGFKRKLGDLYFEPSIAASAVECNITIGNAFNRLLAESNEQALNKVNDGEDIAGAFYDASPGAETRINEILSEIRTGGENYGDTDHNASVNEILELVCEGEDPRIDDDHGAFDEEPQEIEESGGHHSVPTAQKRLESVFFTLSQPDPNHAILRDHMRKYPSIDQIDLRDFIGRPEDPTDHLCRNVLGVILWVEELCEHELNSKGEMSASLKEELHRLLRKSEEFSEQLDYLVRENSSDSQHRLLMVSNKLLETRLKLKRGIARFTRRNLVPAHTDVPLGVETEAAPAEASGEPREPFRLIDVRSGSANRWLLAATLLVSLACGAIYFLDQQMKGVIPAVARDVEVLDVRRLPKGEFLQQAYRRNDLVFITAKSGWAQLSEEEQRQNLKELLDYPSKTKVNTVMITDGMGRVLGDISPEGTKLLGKLQIADAELKAPVSDPVQSGSETQE